MIKVSNKKCIRRLSVKSLKAAGSRNIIAAVAIALTTLLFTSLFTVSMSMMDTIQNGTFMQVGTCAHGGFKFLTQEQYDKVAADPEVKDISYNIIIGTGQNPEIVKLNAEVRYTEEKSAEWSFCLPSTGRLPEEKYDIAADTVVLDALGIPHELGQTVHLDFTTFGGAEYSQDFTLCGFWDSSMKMSFHEVFLSREYSDEVCPVKTVPLYESGDSDFSGTINPSIWFGSSWNIDKQMDQLKERCGFGSEVNEGVNWGYTSSTVDPFSILLIIIVLLMTLISGWLIIYNVFRISVVNDIRFYGLLKTIGTTGRQLKRIVRRQALLLCIAGIPAGLAAGYIIGYLLMPFIVSTTNISDSLVVTSDPLVFIGAALFSLVTVMISCVRPCRIAAKVSPVEAVSYTGAGEQKKKRNGKKRGRVRQKKNTKRRNGPFGMAKTYVGRDRKRAAVVIVSLTLSMTILNATYSVVTSFDSDVYVENYSVSDFYLTDSSLRSGYANELIFDGVDSDTVSAVSELPGLEDLGCVRCLAGVHKLSAEALRRAESMVDADLEADELPMPYAKEDIRVLKEEGKVSEYIFGIDDMVFDKMENYSGNIDRDKEKFRSGDYVIVSGYSDRPKDHYYKTGDKVYIDFENGNSKEYTVLAMGEIPYALSPQVSSLIEIDFALPASEYLRQAGETGVMSLAFNVSDDDLQQTADWCEGYTDGSNLTYVSRETLKEDFEASERIYYVVGAAFSFILGLIGLLNFINTLITSINTRKRELAVMQSIGMTGKQLRSMLTFEGLIYAASTILLTLTAGTALCYLIVKLITREMWAITWHFTVSPVLITAPLLAAAGYLIPLILYKKYSSAAIVERLRECGY